MVGGCGILNDMSTIEPVITVPDLSVDTPGWRKDSLACHLAESLVVAVTLTAISYFVGLRAHWVAKLDWLEVFAVWTSYACTWLCVRERRINYPIGAVSSAAYALLFYRAGLIASTALNLYLCPYLVYGWIRWRRDADTRPITKVSARMVPVYLLITALGYLAAVVIARAFGGSMAWTDGVILAGSLLAQTLLDNKKISTWGVWAVVNVFAIFVYSSSGLPLVGFQYVTFLFNTFIGYVVWRKSMRSPSWGETLQASSV